MTEAAPSFMDAALQAASEAAHNGEVPVGAAVVRRGTGEILAVCRNRTEELRDPTAHAEILAIRAACAKAGAARLPDCDLYVTLEPCPMCAQAISFARIGRLYYGAEDPKGGGVDHGARVFSAASCHHRPEIYGGIAARQSAALLQEFFRERR